LSAGDAGDGARVFVWSTVDAPVTVAPSFCLAHCRHGDGDGDASAMAMARKKKMVATP